MFGDRLYVFGSHDQFAGSTYCPNDYVGWSAPLDDLSAWRHEGVLYRATEDPLNRDGRKQLWAPDVVQGPDGRYYLFYALSFVPRMSVAVADSPAGPYRFHAHVRHPGGAALGERRGDVFPFDPGVLVDDDGRIYLYCGFAPHTPFLRARIAVKGLRHDGAYAMELEPDMCTLRSASLPVLPGVRRAAGTSFEQHAFFEAASPRRIDGRYYLVYSSALGHELCYAISEFPDRGFAFEGTLVSNGDIGIDGRSEADALNYTANNHGGLVELGDRWHIFYHRHTNRSQLSRQGCAEPLERTVDGGFRQAEMTSCGLNGGPLAGSGTYSARIACTLQSGDGAFPYPFRAVGSRHWRAQPYLTQTGADREGDGDQYIANMRDGATAGFRYFDLSGTARVSVSVRGPGSGTIIVSTAPDGPPIATIKLAPAPASASAVEPRQAGAALAGGGACSALYFRFRGSDSIDFLDFTLEPQAVSA
ncbi:family 43 glycosylhydrolase [Yinghuangia soli]|uniref:Family 43 glycosylhydrolase n=1 Tax=Yinghuangia soli TaxID=2908204 RepID=A0AA41Q4E7_9ACTN|nr:family 43 glycosylhydrolase [Yinghuangia soli]MCF2531131.1 family 43 glycosylhydrolase [Yinghuangia soli]